jgi:hypothetical protein
MIKKDRNVVIVSCTRKNIREFYADSCLGKSIKKIRDFSSINKHSYIFERIYTENTKGLGENYNDCINHVLKNHNINNEEFTYLHPNEIIFLFVHDDVSIEDMFLTEKLNKAIEQYDIIGLAGTKHWELKSPAVWNNSPREKHTGAVAHTKDGHTWMTSFGVFGKALLIDGLFIAVKGEVFENTPIRFDPQFDFHFYDLDFCLQAYQQKLQVGTYPIWVTHNSIGDWTQDQKWHNKENDFLNKWK